MALMINSTLNGVPMTYGPYEVRDALRKAVELRSDGHRMITFRDLDRGVVLDIERFMRGNPSAMQ